MDVSIYSVKEVSEQEFQTIEKQFFESDFVLRENREHIFEILHTFFAEADLNSIKQYRNTYWKLYVYACWNLINKQTDTFIKKMCEQQIFDAYRLGIDVWDKIVRYMTFYKKTDEVMIDSYGRFRNAFFNSDFVISKSDTNTVTMNSIIQDIKRIDNHGNDSLEMANYFTKLSSMMFPKGTKYSEYAILDSLEGSVKNFVGLIHFFLGVKNADIGYVLTAYGDSLGPPLKQVERLVSSDEGILPKSEYRLSEETKPLNTDLYINIKKELEQRFNYDHQHDLQPIEDVLGRLDELAVEHSDTKVEELYYFDEVKGHFVWNDELLV